MDALIGILVLIFRLAWWLIEIICRGVFLALIGLIILLITIFSKKEETQVIPSGASQSTASKCIQSYAKKYRINKYGEIFEVR